MTKDSINSVINAKSLKTYDSLGSATRAVAEAFDSADLFFGHGTDNALDEALWLTTHVLDISYADPDWQQTLQVALDSSVDDDVASRLAAFALARVTTRQPMAYVLGEAWFAGLRFTVTPAVLVPRSPIAELIATGFQPWLDPEQPLKVLDLCTGSACIAIACAVYFPHWTVDASDISAEALAVAAQNVAAYDVGDRVTLIEADLFDAPLLAEYDLIVTNPPYVDAPEMNNRPDEFRYEPVLGLAAGDDGLDLVRTILAEAADHLSSNGVLVCEVGVSDEALQATYSDVPFTWIEFSDDSQGVFVIDKEQLLEHSDRLQQQNQDRLV